MPLVKKKILIHPGFHKTGTTTLQRGLADKREVLAADLDMVILDEIRPASLLSRRYSVDPLPRTLAKFSEGFASILSTRDPLDDRPLFISSEALVGQIPGRHGFQTYAHAPVLMDQVVKATRGYFGPESAITVWFTKRACEPWQRSVYYQNVRTVRVTDDFDTYRRKLNTAPGLDKVVADVRAALPAWVDVQATLLEDANAIPLGLMGIALGLLGVHAEKLAPPSRQNAQVDGLLEALLQLNRSDLSEESLADEKHKLLAQYRKGRGPRPGGV